MSWLYIQKTLQYVKLKYRWVRKETIVYKWLLRDMPIKRTDNLKEKVIQIVSGGKDLSNILKSPKLRGGLGEQLLYDILANSLPNDRFKTQLHKLDGTIHNPKKRRSAFGIRGFQLYKTQKDTKYETTARNSRIGRRHRRHW